MLLCGLNVQNIQKVQRKQNLQSESTCWNGKTAQVYSKLLEQAFIDCKDKLVWTPYLCRKVICLSFIMCTAV